MLGIWIDGLAERRRDFVVREPDMHPGLLYGDKGRRCLVGAAYKAGDYLSMTVAERKGMADAVAVGIGSRFDRLCDRFGRDRIVRAVKLRAGATLEDLTPTERDAALTPERVAVEV